MNCDSARNPTTAAPACWIALAMAAALIVARPASGDDWLQFRGSDNASLAADSELPIEFGPEKNVVWKAGVPGEGVCGPIVVGDRVILTASSGAVTQNRLHVLCYDAESGKQLWERQFWATGRCFHNETSANAAPTPASDGQRIFAFYSSSDLACLDLDGNLLWYRGLGSDYPKGGNDFGMASSPLVIGDTVIVQVESQADAYAAGIYTATGENRWRIERPRQDNWSSPTSLRGPGGEPLVVLQSTNGVSAHNPRTGEQLWRFETPCAGIPSSTPSGDMLFVPSRGITALNVSAEATSPSLAWDSSRLAPGNASPVIFEGKIYLLASRSGVLTCGDAATGDLLWQLRLSGTFWATPVVAGGRLYCVNQEGKVLVVDLDGEKGTLLATNELPGRFLGSPAVAGDALYLRSDNELWKIAETN